MTMPIPRVKVWSDGVSAASGWRVGVVSLTRRAPATVLLQWATCAGPDRATAHKRLWALSGNRTHSPPESRRQSRAKRSATAPGEQSQRALGSVEFLVG